MKRPVRLATLAQRKAPSTRVARSGHAEGGLGEFEQSVLLAIAHLGDAAYGVSVRHEIETRSGRVVSIGALYTAIDRLERKGYVRSTLSEPSPERGGRSKRFVRLTAAGAAALQRSRERMERMWAGLTPDRLKPARER